MEGNQEELRHEAANKKVVVDGEVKDLVDENEESSEEDFLSAFPLARVKKLMQCGTEETIKSDAIKLMSKAAELFIQEFSQKTFQVTKSRNKKTAILVDLLETVSNHENLAFLKDTGILHASDSARPSE